MFSVCDMGLLSGGKGRGWVLQGGLRGKKGTRGLVFFLRSLPSWRPVARAAHVCGRRLQLHSGEHGAQPDAGTTPGS